MIDAVYGEANPVRVGTEPVGCPGPVRSHARSDRYTFAVMTLRLNCSTFWVDVRLLEINGRWIASADTLDGPSLGLGKGAVEAIERALEPFAGIAHELLASLPRGEIN